MSQPLVSVVMSVLNDDLYLEEAIESILNQSFKNFEFIIVDDGSVDNSLAIIKRYQGQDKRIKVISRENKGLPYSLNEAISISKGKYIARMDSDDISLPDRFKMQFEIMERNEEIGVCGTLAYLFSEDSSKKYLLFHPEHHDSLVVRLLFSVCFIHPTVMIRKRIINEFSYVYDEEFKNSQDYELWSRLSKITKFYNIQKPLLLYRKNNKGITAKVADDSFNKRYPLVSLVQKKQLASLGVHLDEKRMIYHFMLGLNAEMINLNGDIEFVEKYFNLLVLTNKEKEIFKQKELEIFLKRKYFVFCLLSFFYGDKKIFFKMFDVPFIKGGGAFIKEKFFSFFIR